MQNLKSKILRAFTELMDSWEAMEDNKHKSRFRQERHAYLSGKSLGISKRLEVLEAFDYNIEVTKTFGIEKPKEVFEFELDVLRHVFYNWGKYSHRMDDGDKKVYKGWIVSHTFDHVSAYKMKSIIRKAGFLNRYVAEQG